MEQIVYVVNDKKEQKVIGVFNEYRTAERIALDMERACYDGSEISITPVCVDRMTYLTGSRQYLLNQQEREQGKEADSNELFRRHGGTSRANVFGGR